MLKYINQTGTLLRVRVKLGVLETNGLLLIHKTSKTRVSPHDPI